MSTKKIEQIAKTPDQVLKTLTTGFQWSQQHSQMVLGLIGLFLVIGIGLSIKDHLSTKTEVDLQEKYYSLERVVLEKKRAFAAAQTAAQQPKPVEKNAKAKPAEPVVAKKEDFSSYSDVVNQLKQLALQNAHSKAGQMSALQASQILVEFGKADEALELLNGLNIGKSNDLLAALILDQKGNIQANLNQCQPAVTTWDQILSIKAFEFLHKEVKLKQGLCYENLKDNAKAEKIYQELSQKTGDEKQESNTAQEAQKYLRLLRIKKGT